MSPLPPNRLSHYIPSKISVKSWRVETPSCDVARPTHCPSCGAAAHAAGKRKRLHGHGLRDRIQQGPPTIGGSSAPVTIKLRRYLCTGCTHVCVVGPRDVAPRYLYSGATIVYAFGLLFFQGLSIAQVRKRLCAWQKGSPESMSRWRSIKRWLADIVDGRLFLSIALCGTSVGAGPPLVERVAQSVVARAPAYICNAPLAERVFLTAQEVWLGPVGPDRGG